MAQLSTALAHLRAFRDTLTDREPVDKESGLTTDDLTTIIEAVDAVSKDHVAPDPEEHVGPSVD